jgi:hypothetical protein
MDLLRTRRRRAAAGSGFLTLLCAAPLVAAACMAAPAAPHCRPGEQPAIMESLYFGTATPDGKVSAADWQSFLADVITPRFPEGLTSWAAEGQWQNGAGKVQKESSYVLHVIHPDSPRTEAAIREVVSIYKSRFHQEAVLRVRGPACISF